MGKGLNKIVAVLLTAGSSLIGVAPGVQANPVPWGDPALGHSWDQLWVQTSDHAFDTVVARIVAPPLANFESPGFLGFSVDSWVIQSATARQIVAQGAATDHLEFTTHFSGFPTDYSADNPFVIGFYFYNNNNFIEGHLWTWDGNIWVDPPDGDPLATPDGGSTLLLLGISAFGIAAFFRKKLAV